VDVSSGAAVERVEDRLREGLEQFISRQSGASAAVETYGTSSDWAPTSSTRLIATMSFHGTRTTGCDG